MSAAWPTAAAACFSGMDRGFPPSPSRAVPAAIAPEVTRATSTPPAITAASSAARGSMRAGSGPSTGSAMSPLPTLTTTRRNRRARHAWAPAARSTGAAARAAPRAARSSASPAPVRAARGSTGSRRRRAMATTRFEAGRRALEVDLVRGDELRARRQLGRVGPELRLDRPPVLHRVASGGGIEVEEVDEDARPLEMPEEAEPETLALRRARDQPGHVRDDEAPLRVEPDEPERRDQRRERIVGDLRPRGRETGDQGRLARVREAHHPDVGQEPELEPEPALLAGLARLGAARGPVRGGGEARVAAATAAAPGDVEPLARSR